MLEDGVDVQSLTQIVLDVLLYNFWRRNHINKRFFSNEKWLVCRPTVKFSDILNDFKGFSIFQWKKQSVDIIIPLSKVIEENVSHDCGQKSYVFPVLQHLTHMHFATYFETANWSRFYKTYYKKVLKKDDVYY